MTCIVKCHTQQILDQPPPIGSILTIKHSGFLKNGTLKNPFYWRSTGQLQFMVKLVLTLRNELTTFQEHSFDWRDHLNQRDLIDLIGSKLKLKNLEDFYNITQVDMKPYGGDILLDNYFDGSMYQLFSSLYPNHSWYKWNFSQRIESSFWDNKNNQRDFMDQLGNRLEYKEINAWYGVTKKQIQENGGLSLLNKYGGSPSKLVMAVYDTHQWDKMRFRLAGSNERNHWEDRDNRIAAVRSLGKKLKIEDMSDWYRISLSQMKKIEGLLNKYPLEKLLPETFPHHQWDIALLERKGKFVSASQHWLKVKVSELFPQSGIESNNE